MMHFHQKIMAVITASDIPDLLSCCAWTEIENPSDICRDTYIRTYLNLNINFERFSINTNIKFCHSLKFCNNNLNFIFQLFFDELVHILNIEIT